MKGLLYVLILIVLSSCQFTQHKESVPVFKSNNGKFTCILNMDTTHVDWANVPRQDVYSSHIECPNAINPITIISDIDTFSANISPDSIIRIQLNLRNQAPVILEFIGIYKNATFSDQYILENKNKTTIEIPEVHELANILVAISNIGQKDGNMVNLVSKYHQEVLDHFLPFVNHPIMDTINQNIIDQGPNSYWYYYALKMNACGYIFNENGQIVNKGIIRKMGFDNRTDPFVENSLLMEDFARRTKFREFYTKHLQYYNSLIEKYKKLNPIATMQTWLEKKFGATYDNYTIYFSPLVEGAHASSRFSDNGFNQTIMFVCKAEYNYNYNTPMNEMINSRVVFTEIDHNFVNPVSDKYADIIHKAFSNREKWMHENADKSAYTNPMSVFNEYMTWGLFSIYCLDNYPEEDARKFISTMEDQMVWNRKFIEFKMFNQELIRIQMANPNISINGLFEKITSWCINQNRAS